MLEGLLNMSPGPTPVARSVLEALGQQVVPFTAPSFVEVVERVNLRLKQMCNTNGMVFVFPGTGTLAMESAISNTISETDRVLILSNGKWGERFVQIVRGAGLSCDIIRAESGQTVLPAEVKRALEQNSGKYKAVLATHIETSTGVKAPIGEIGQIVSDAGLLYIVDAVCSLGAASISMEEMKIDILVSASQKALGAPPGLSIVAVGEKALMARKAMPGVRSFYCDWLEWERVYKDPCHETHITHPVNLFYAMDKGLDRIFNEGLDNCFLRHKICAQAIREGLDRLGFSIFAREDLVSETVTVVLYPNGVDDGIRTLLADQGVIVAPGLEGKGFRIGHMGEITGARILALLGVVEKVLKDDFNADCIGKGVIAAQKVLSESRPAWVTG